MTRKANARPTPALPTGEGAAHPTPALPTGEGEAHPTPAIPTGEGEAHIAPAIPTGEGDAHIASGLRQRDEKAHGAVHGLYTANKRIYDKLKRYAREMRQDPTPAEGLLWRALRGEKAGAYFRRQHVLGQFIVDFVCLDRRLVIEVDGDIHDHQQAEDAQRTQWLNRTGFQVIRFRNEEVLHHMPGVLERIRSAIKAQPSLRSTNLPRAQR